MSLGPVMIDVVGLQLSPEDIRRLQHPLVGGVILFSRNYDNPQQLIALTQHIAALRSPSLLIAVDHEGGRVQRFRQGFTAIPAMRHFGQLWDTARHQALQLAKTAGWLLAAELRAHGIDFSFTPVLDMDYGDSQVIGNRAFHHDAVAIHECAYALMQGLQQAGMQAVGKHFPGHGFVQADSHVAIPVDERSFDDIAQRDMQPFRHMIDDGLAAIMPAHVIYPQVDSQPAGFSQRWLQKVLRERLGFDGVIFSDDLSMQGATVAGDVCARARAALQAGCDMVLLCNQPDLADQLLAQLDWQASPASQARLARMRAQGPVRSMQALQNSPDYQAALQALQQLATT